MKRLIVVILLLVLTSAIYSQIPEMDKQELYPDNYTFEKAVALSEEGAYEKAIWFYINLFPENKLEVIEKVKELSKKMGDSIDIKLFIKKSFVLYSSFDPMSSSFNNGKLSVDIAKLKRKSGWADALSLSISDTEKPLNSASEYNLRGLSKTKIRDFKSAIADFDKAVEMGGTGQIYFNRGYSKSMIDDFEGAVADYNKSIEMKYRLEESYFERGYCKEQLKKTDDAIADYTKAIEIKEEYSYAYSNRGFIKFSQKEYKSAIRDFDKAIKYEPNFASAYVNRGFAKQALGDEKGGCKDWLKALELGFKPASKIINENCK